MAEARTVVQKVKNAVLYSDGLIRIDNVRASYPHLDKPYAGEEGQDAKYGIVALLDKKTHEEAKALIVKQINAMMKEAKVDKVAADKKFIRDGDLSDKDEAQGMYTISARESRRPICRDGDGQRLEPDEVADVIYAGCYVSVLIRPWGQFSSAAAKKFGKRVNAGIVAVRFMKDGEPFGQGRISDDDIDEMYDDFEGEKTSRSSRKSDDDDDDL